MAYVELRSERVYAPGCWWRRWTWRTRTRGKVVQVDPMKSKLKPPGTKRLKEQCNILLSKSAFKINLRRYTVEPPADERVQEPGGCARVGGQLHARRQERRRRRARRVGVRGARLEDELTRVCDAMPIPAPAATLVGILLTSIIQYRLAGSSRYALHPNRSFDPSA